MMTDPLDQQFDTVDFYDAGAREWLTRDEFWRRVEDKARIYGASHVLQHYDKDRSRLTYRLEARTPDGRKAAAT